MSEAELEPTSPTQAHGFIRALLTLLPLAVLGIVILHVPTGSSEDRIVVLRQHVAEKIGLFAAVAGFVYSGLMGLLLGFGHLTRGQKWMAAIWLLVSFPAACCGPGPLAGLFVPYQREGQLDEGGKTYHVFHLYSKRMAEKTRRYRLVVEEGSNAIYLRCRVLGEADLDAEKKTWSPLLRPSQDARISEMAVRKSPDGSRILLVEGNLLWLTYDVAAGRSHPGGDPFTWLGPGDEIESMDVTGFLEARFLREGKELPVQAGVLTLDDVRRGAEHPNIAARKLLLQWLDRQDRTEDELAPIAARLRADPALRGN